MAKKKEKVTEKPVQKPKPEIISRGNEIGKIRSRMVWTILLLCVFLYGNTLWNGYSMDDELVTNNHEIVSKGIKGIPKIFTSRYAVNANQNYEYRPVVLTSYALEYQFFGQNAGVSHFVNLMLYAICCIVLFHLLLKIFNNHHWILPVIAVLLFVIHPIHTEVVASLKNRDEILCLLFSLLAAISFFRLMETDKLKYAVYGMLLMALSFLSKKSSAPMIVLIPMMIYFSSGITMSKKTLKLGISLVLSFLILKTMMVAFLDKDDLQRNLMFFENPLYVNDYGFFDRIPMFFYSVGYYIKLLVLPHPLSVFYGYSHVEIAQWGDPLVWVSLLFCTSLGIYCLINIKKKSPWMFGVLFFFIAISYFSNLVKPAPGIIAERFVFLASIGFCITMAWVILTLFKVPFNFVSQTNLKIPAPLKTTFAVIFILCSVKVITRNNDWFSHSTIYKHDIIYTENSAKLNSLLGALYVDQLDKNRTLIMNLNSLQPAMITADMKKNLLNQQQVKIKIDSAIFHFYKALEVFPDYIAVNNNLGAVYFSYVDNVDSAKKYFTRAVELDTNYVQALYNLASCYEKQIGEYEEMGRYFIRADTVKNIDNSSAELKNVSVDEITSRFIKFFRSYDQLKGRLTATTNTAVGVLMQNNDFSQAKEEFKKTVLYNLTGKLAEKITPVVLDSLSAAMVENSKEIYRTMTLTDINIKTEKATDNVMYPVIDSMVAEFYLDFGISGDEVWELNSVCKNFATKTASENLKGMISCLNRSLDANPEYFMSYSKLSGIYRERNMGDSLISLSTRLLEVKVYMKADLFTSIANGHTMKGEDAEAAIYYDKVITEREKSLNRILIVHSQFASAKFNEVSQRLYQYQANFKRDIINGCNYLANKYSIEGNQELSQKYLIKAQTYK